MSDVIAGHLQGVQQFIAAACEQMKIEDADAYAALAVAVQQGAAFQVVTCLSPAGLCESRVELVAPGGQVVNIAHVAFATAH